MVTDLWRVLAKIDTSRLHSVRWHSRTDGNIATHIICCVNIDDDFSTYVNNLVNLGPVTPDILRLICMGGKGTRAKIRYTLVSKGHSLGGSSIASL